MALLEKETAGQTLEVREMVARLHTQKSSTSVGIIRFRTMMQEGLVNLSDVVVPRSKLVALFLTNLLRLLDDTVDGIIKYFWNAGVKIICTNVSGCDIF